MLEEIVNNGSPDIALLDYQEKIDELLAKLKLDKQNRLSEWHDTIHDYRVYRTRLGLSDDAQHDYNRVPSMAMLAELKKCVENMKIQWVSN